MEQVKLLSTTAVLAVLVWAAADSLVNETGSVEVTVEVVPKAATSSMLIDVVAPVGGAFEIEISGPRRIVEAVQSQSPLAARLRIAERPTGPVTITMDNEYLERELAEQFNEFHSLAVVSVEPATLRIHVDRMLSKELGITMARLGLSYDVEPQLKRTSSNVHLRESRFREFAPLGELPPLDISSDVDRLFREQPPGQSKTISITLDVRDYGPDARLAPDAVDVTATVKVQRSVAQIAAVPILLAVSFTNLEKAYRPVARDGTPLDIVAPGITVSGPSDAVDRLVRGDTRVYGIIRLKAADLEEPGAIKLMTPEYQLPPDVELAVQPQPVEFKLIAASDTVTAE